MSKKIFVVGVGPGDKSYITPAALQKIQSAKFLAGGRRVLEDFATKEQETCPITVELHLAKKFISEKLLLDDVVVMVSGDPGYFSLLDFLRKNFPREQIEVIPSISAIQLAFAKLALSWYSATLLSFHGREPDADKLNFERGKILGMLTDAKFNSATISEILVTHGWQEISQLAICEKLSYPDEKITLTNLGDAIKSEPIKHCVLIVGEKIY